MGNRLFWSVALIPVRMVQGLTIISVVTCVFLNKCMGNIAKKMDGRKDEKVKEE